MIAARFAEYGGPEVLHGEDVDEPRPGPGEVRIRMRAAGVQPFDTKLRRGDMATFMPVPFPHVPGSELAGVVDEIGDGVDQFHPGDEVMAFGDAASAELVVVPADQVAAKPSAVAWEQAGALSASGQTAVTALDDLGVGEGDTLVVHAAAGGVGVMAVQLARRRGATVIGTASEANHDFLRGLGAIPVTYGDGLSERVRAAAPDGVSVVLDCVGGPALRESLDWVEDRDRIGTIADFAQGPALGVRVIQSRRSAPVLAELANLVAHGDLQVEIAGTYPLTEASEAHRRVESGHVRGKVVVLGATA